MTDDGVESDGQASTGAAASENGVRPALVPLDQPLPEIESPMDERAVVEALETLARHGKLAGFVRGSRGELFRVDAFGQPFDYDLIAHAEPGDSGTRLRFTLRRRPRMPIIAAVLLIVSVEPGRYFVDQLIPGSWNWIPTMWWYYPLTIVPIPWIWRSLSRKSLAAAHDHAHEQIGKISQVIGAI